MRRAIITMGLGVVLIFLARPSSACTNFLITKGATADGSTMISYAADSHVLYGEMYLTPGGIHPDGAMLDVYEWDTGKYLGQIPQVKRTFTVVGNMNEHQVSIGETTYGGREELFGGEGEMDYGSLMYITMQRASTAREAVKIMGQLVEKHGYISEGESFSVADPQEVWFVDMIGKGPEEKGAVWVARKIPDGYVSAHANQARIRQFPRNDPKNCLYAKDVVSFARKKGYFKGSDKDFSFADAYAPMNYTGLRICEARVWSFFRRVAPSLKLSPDYVMGKEGAKPLPLWIKPDKKLSIRDVMELMRDHFEDSPMDLHEGIGAGPYKLPYRWRPLFWEVEGKDDQKFFNERSTSTQQTGFSFISQMRSNLPDPIGGLVWFAVDDTNSTVYVPMYAGIREVPKPYRVGTGNFYDFTWKSAFWTFNAVSNFAYLRYCDMIKDIKVVQRKLEDSFVSMQHQVDQAALKLYQRAPELARDYLTKYSSRQARKTVRRWRKLWEELLLRYLDGNVRTELGKVTHPGYPKEWYQRILKESGDKYLMIKIKGEEEAHDQPAKEPARGGYFHSREELGKWISQVPTTMDFKKEKLLLIPGTARCGQPPQCCLKPELDKKTKKLTVTVPAAAMGHGHGGGEKEKCGQPGWLVRLPVGEKRQIVLQYQKAKGH